ncbi:hypothetical protein CTAYLR_002740 [Chrysophaeum taylorii]|uniref:Peptidyl-prolyl cis-trans isomerase n=1 Tax=Chrysophaeum taylorii TaxID=2483200 RepID=A0AAD7XN78_9STRA|nr:hypothetical protein CTAYLR_002740 [Chrysophaeum taylorii]
MMLLWVAFGVGPVGCEQLIDFDIKVAPSDDRTRRFTVRVREDWAPIGAARLVELVGAGHYDGCAFFRVIRRFMCQFGISGNVTKQSLWRRRPIGDETTARGSNRRGMITFAHAGKNTRSTQLFINLVDNTRLDKENFPPIGEVVAGMDVVDAIRATGEGAPGGPGPNQGLIQRRGDAYLLENFPDLTRIIKATIRRPPQLFETATTTTPPRLPQIVEAPASATSESASRQMTGAIQFAALAAIFFAVVSFYVGASLARHRRSGPALLDVESPLVPGRSGAADKES